MPKETFSGGDDDKGGAPPPKKKLVLHKFGLAPDVNIRDVFWRIMASYAATKKPGIDLGEMKHEATAILRVALAVVSNQGSEDYGLSPRFVVYYTMMMVIDSGWNNAFVDFLLLSADQKEGVKKEITNGLKKIITQEKYVQEITKQLTAMLRTRDSAGIALEYIATLKSIQLINALKKELIIIARGDIGENQFNAIKAISLIKEDDEVKKSLITLLSHWDVQTRKEAVETLKDLIGDSEVKAAAEKRLPYENDSEIKAILTKLAK
ncbi:MAG: hypothetical protein ABID61_02230 [Candidatus Micrarchaeota archaeon]